MIYPKENWLTDDEHGIQMPWYTRPALEVIEKWEYISNLSDGGFVKKFIFEYGVGYSTKWYQSRMAMCYGVDHDKKWLELSGLSSFPREDETDYIYSIYEIRTFFDIVVIDGLYRDDCTKHALNKLKSGGKLILDNWLQPEVEEFWPKTQKLIEGMKIEVYKEPTHPYWQTAIVTVP